MEKDDWAFSTANKTQNISSNKNDKWLLVGPSAIELITSIWRNWDTSVSIWMSFRRTLFRQWTSYKKSSMLYKKTYRPHTTVKNARNMKSVSQAKLPYFKGIFKLWTHEQQELPFLQMFISFANQNLAVLCVKRPWNRFLFFWNLWCCMSSISSNIS